VTRLDPGDGHYVYSTYLGGEGADSAEGVVVDSIGRAIMAGTTWGANMDSASAGPGGFYDAFLSVLKKDGNAIDDSIRLGGTGHERTRAMTLDRYDNAYIIAQTFSADYPTVRPLQPSYGGGGFDAVVTKVAVGNLTALYAEPSRLDFGAEMVSARSTPQFVRLTSIGSGTITIDSVTASGDFEVSGGCTPLAVGDVCDWAVTFTPTASGPRVGFLAVMHDGLDSGYLVDLRGVGSAPEIRLSKDSVLFDSQLVGTESGPQEITLVNAGTASLDLSGIHVTGDFVQSNNCPSNVAVGGSCRIQVAFRPSTAGSHEGALVVTNHLPEEERQTALTGNGSDFALEAPATPMSIMAGESASLEFVVTPVAGFRGSLEFTCSGEPPASDCSLSPRQVSLDAADPLTIRSSITTTARSQTHPGRKTPLGPLLLLTILLGIELAKLGGLRPRSPWGLRPALVWALALTFAMGVASCGGGSSYYPSPSGATGTPAGSYLVSLTARCGAVSRTTSASLIIR
jgi:hypothetical protein